MQESRHTFFFNLFVTCLGKTGCGLAYGKLSTLKSYWPLTVSCCGLKVLCNQLKIQEKKKKHKCYVSNQHFQHLKISNMGLT